MGSDFHLDRVGEKRSSVKGPQCKRPATSKKKGKRAQEGKRDSGPVIVMLLMKTLHSVRDIQLKLQWGTLGVKEK